MCLVNTVYHPRNRLRIVNSTTNKNETFILKGYRTETENRWKCQKVLSNSLNYFNYKKMLDYTDSKIKKKHKIK